MDVLSDSLMLWYNITYDLYTDPLVPILVEDYYDMTWYSMTGGESWISDCKNFVDLPDAKFSLQRVNFANPSFRKYQRKSLTDCRRTDLLMDVCVVELPGHDDARRGFFFDLCDYTTCIVAFILPKGSAFQPSVTTWVVEREYDTIFWLDQSICDVEYIDGELPNVGYAMIIGKRDHFFQRDMCARYQLVHECAKASYTMKTLPNPRMIDMYNRQGFLATGPAEFEIRRQSTRMKRIQLWLD